MFGFELFENTTTEFLADCELSVAFKIFVISMFCPQQTMVVLNFFDWYCAESVRISKIYTCGNLFKHASRLKVRPLFFLVPFLSFCLYY